MIELDDFLKEQIKAKCKTGENRFGVRISDFELTHLNYLDTSHKNAGSFRL